MRARVPFLASLLLSVFLHAALLLAPSGRPPKQHKLPPLEVELLPHDVLEPPPKSGEPLPDTLSTEPPPESSPKILPAPPLPPPPVKRVPTTPSIARNVVRQAQAQLMKQLLYPPEAISQGLEGEAVLLIKLDGEGNITAISLARSSGHALLDAAAMKAARQLGRLSSSSNQFLLPVEFALE